MRAYVVTEAVPGKLRPGSWARRIYDAAARGEVEAERCPVLMRDYLGPSLDTTIFAIANLMLLFGRNPDQWDILRADPALVPNAVNEALRLESPIRGFTRVVDAGFPCCTAIIAARRVTRAAAVCVSQPRRAEVDRPGPFRYRAAANADHLGFGHGIHICAGMHLARLEMQALARRLVARVRRFEVGDAGAAA